MKKVYSELKELKLLLGAILVTIFLVPVGITHNIIQSLRQSFQMKFWEGVWKFIKYWGFIAYQIWQAIKYLMFHTVFALDLIWNASRGEFIEGIVTKEEETLYGKGNISVSAATGHLEHEGKLDNEGIWFTDLLSKVLGENHSIEAYNSELKK
jgi:hypothetical protein